MKVIICLGIFLISGVSAQNAFVDGIQNTKEVTWTDGKTRFNALGFKIDLINICAAKYIATEMLFEPEGEKSYVVETNWKWIDISSIEIDTSKHILRFNSKNPMPCAKKDVSTKLVTKDPENIVLNIYFKTTLMCRNAANWALEHIKTCGGKAVLIN